MTTKPAQFTPGTCQCRWSGAVNFVMCPLHTAAPAMYEALAKLRLEAIHYRNTGVGIQFLNCAIEQAELAINQVWGEGESNYDTEREG